MEMEAPFDGLLRIPNFDKMNRKDLQLRCYRDLIKLFSAPILLDKISAVN